MPPGTDFGDLIIYYKRVIFTERLQPRQVVLRMLESNFLFSGRGGGDARREINKASALARGDSQINMLGNDRRNCQKKTPLKVTNNQYRFRPFKFYPLRVITVLHQNQENTGGQRLPKRKKVVYLEQELTV